MPMFLNCKTFLQKMKQKIRASSIFLFHYFFPSENSVLAQLFASGGGWEIRTPAPGFPRLTI